MSNPSPPPSLPPGLTLLRILQGHKSQVNSVSWSPDGTRVASSGGVLSWGVPNSNETIVHLWDGRSGRRLHRLKGHMHNVQSVAWSPDGSRLASGSCDRTVRLWDASNGRFLFALLGHSDQVNSVVWSPDGMQVASASNDQTVRLWDASSERLVLALPHESQANRVAWSPDGSRLAFGSDDGTVQLWDLSRMHHLHTLEGHTRQVTSVVWSPDGTWLASGSNDCTVRLWDVSDGRFLFALLGHTGSVENVMWSPDGTLLASGGFGGLRAGGWGHISELRLWRTDTWEEVALLTGLGGSGLVAWNPRRTQLVTNGQRNEDLVIYHVDVPLLLKRSASPETVHYKSAKVVLVGESGVGKSGLALRLTGQPFVATESTHGRYIRLLGMQEVTQARGVREQREVWLWDLAGQRDYRLLHQLHLHEATIALIVFDATHDADPLAGIRYWLRALRLAQRDLTASPLRIFLVAARTDRGHPAVSRERLEALGRELGCVGYIETSAKMGLGIDELGQAIRGALQWELLPSVTSTKLLQEIKVFLLAEGPSGPVLRTVEELYQAFLLADRTRIPDAALRRQFEAGLGHLEGQGALRRLGFGNLVLLQPERLDGYASALLIAVGNERDGLGLIAETHVQQGQFVIPQEARLGEHRQEQWLLLAMIEELVRHELALRVEGTLLFPSQSSREHPEQTTLAQQQRVTFSFAGPVLSIYTTLVVRLAQCGIFQQQGLWHQVATYTTRLGGRYGLLLTLRGEARAELGLCFDGAASEEMCFLFEDFVQQHLERLASGSVERRRDYVCPTCGDLFTEKQVKIRQERGFITIRCSACDTEISLLDGVKRLTTASSSQVTQMEQTANAGRDHQSAQATLQGKIATQDFDVFLCYNERDRVAVRQLGEQLKQMGILPWLDEWELRPGLPWQRTLEEQITKIKAAAVCVGKSGLGPWQQQESDAFLREFVRRGCPVIPVLLSDAPQQPTLPVFLKGMTWVNFRVKEPDPMQRLMWGIMGRRV